MFGQRSSSALLVMEKFSSEPWFEPEPSRTEPKVQFKLAELNLRFSSEFSKFTENVNSPEPVRTADKNSKFKFEAPKSCDTVTASLFIENACPLPIPRLIDFFVDQPSSTSITILVCYCLIMHSLFIFP